MLIWSRAALAAALFALILPGASGQTLVTYNIQGQTWNGTSFAPSSVANHVVGSSISVTGPAAYDIFFWAGSAENLWLSGWPADDPDPSQSYYSFTLSAEPGFLLTLDGVQIGLARENTSAQYQGPTRFELHSSLDGFLGPIAVLDLPPVLPYDQNSIQQGILVFEPGVEYRNIEGVEFRLYASRAPSVEGGGGIANFSGSFSYQDGLFSVVGSASDVIVSGSVARRAEQIAINAGDGLAAVADERAGMLISTLGQSSNSVFGPGSGTILAQPFVTGDSEQWVTEAYFDVRDNVGTLTATIREDVGGEPGAVLGTVGSVNVGSLGSAFQTVRVAAASPVRLNASSQYWVTVQGTGADPQYRQLREFTFDAASLWTRPTGVQSFRSINGGDSWEPVSGVPLGFGLFTSPTVRVTDVNGDPVAEEIISFAITSGGGSLASAGSAATAQTDFRGIAAAPVWTLGPNPGSNTLEASSPGLTGSPVIFTAEVVETANAPVITEAAAGYAQVSVEFTPPAADGGAPITNYEYSLDNGQSWLAFDPPVTTSPVLITGLANEVSYEIRLRALNAAGAGAASERVIATPRNLRVVISELDQQVFSNDFGPGEGGRIISNAVTFPDGPGVFDGPGFSASFGQGDEIVIRVEPVAGSMFAVYRHPDANGQTLILNAVWQAAGDPTSNFPTPTITFENPEGTPPDIFYELAGLSNNGGELFAQFQADVIDDFTFSLKFLAIPSVTPSNSVR